MLERLAGCWSLLFHEAHAVLWISSLQTNHFLPADKQGPQDIHKCENNNMSMSIIIGEICFRFFLLKYNKKQIICYNFVLQFNARTVFIMYIRSSLRRPSNHIIFYKWKIGDVYIRWKSSRSSTGRKWSDGALWLYQYKLSLITAFILGHHFLWCVYAHASVRQLCKLGKCVHLMTPADV